VFGLYLIVMIKKATLKAYF